MNECDVLVFFFGTDVPDTVYIRRKECEVGKLSLATSTPAAKLPFVYAGQEKLILIRGPMPSIYNYESRVPT
jgi:hypothetical protein